MPDKYTDLPPGAVVDSYSDLPPGASVVYDDLPPGAVIEKPAKKALATLPEGTQAFMDTGGVQVFTKGRWQSLVQPPVGTAKVGSIKGQTTPVPPGEVPDAPKKPIEIRGDDYGNLQRLAAWKKQMSEWEDKYFYANSPDAPFVPPTALTPEQEALLPKGSKRYYAPSARVAGGPQEDYRERNAHGELTPYVEAMTPDQKAQLRRAPDSAFRPLKSLGLRGKAANDAMKPPVVSDGVNTALQLPLGMVKGTPVGLAQGGMRMLPEAQRMVGDIADAMGLEGVADRIWRAADENSGYLQESDAEKAMAPRNAVGSILHMVGMMGAGADMLPDVKQVQWLKDHPAMKDIVKAAREGKYGEAAKGAAASMAIPSLFGAEAGVKAYGQAKEAGASTGKALLYASATGGITTATLGGAGKIMPSFKLPSLWAQAGLKGAESVAGGTVQTLAENALRNTITGQHGSLWDGWGERVATWGLMAGMHIPQAKREAQMGIERRAIEKQVEGEGIIPVASAINSEFAEAYEAYSKTPNAANRKRYERASMRMSLFDPFLEKHRAAQDSLANDVQAGKGGGEDLSSIIPNQGASAEGSVASEVGDMGRDKLFTPGERQPSLTPDQKAELQAKADAMMGGEGFKNPNAKAELTRQMSPEDFVNGLDEGVPEHGSPEHLFGPGEGPSAEAKAHVDRVFNDFAEQTRIQHEASKPEVVERARAAGESLSLAMRDIEALARQRNQVRQENADALRLDGVKGLSPAEQARLAEAKMLVAESDRMGESRLKQILQKFRKNTPLQVNDIGDVQRYLEMAQSDPEAFATKFVEPRQDLGGTKGSGVQQMAAGLDPFRAVGELMGLPADAPRMDVIKAVADKISGLGKSVAETAMRIMQQFKGMTKDLATSIAKSFHEWQERGLISVSKRPGEAGMVVFHGSPHEFGRFSTENIGTGEGNQAYGWGLYFAGDRSVAEWYREKLSGDASGKISFGGRDYDWLSDRKELVKAIKSAGYSSERASMAISYLRDYGSLESARADLRWIPEGEKLDPIREEVLKILDTMDYAKEPGHLYKVEIPDDGSYLHWDKPLSEQPEAVRSALEKIDPYHFSHEGDGYDPKEQGQIIYRRLVRPRFMVLNEATDRYEPVGATSRAEAIAKAGGDASRVRVVSSFDPREASLMLKDAGVSGIKYMDGNSRGTGAENHNYVVFDDAAVKTLERNGSPISANSGFNPVEIADTYRRVIGRELGLGADAPWGEIGPELVTRIKGLGKTVAETAHRIMQSIAGMTRELALNLARSLHESFSGSRESQIGGVGRVNAEKPQWKVIGDEAKPEERVNRDEAMNAVREAYPGDTPEAKAKRRALYSEKELWDQANTDGVKSRLQKMKERAEELRKRMEARYTREQRPVSYDKAEILETVPEEARPHVEKYVDQIANNRIKIDQKGKVGDTLHQMQNMSKADIMASLPILEMNDKFSPESKREALDAWERIGRGESVNVDGLSVEAQNILGIKEALTAVQGNAHAEAKNNKLAEFMTDEELNVDPFHTNRRIVKEQFESGGKNYSKRGMLSTQGWGEKARGIYRATDENGNTWTLIAKRTESGEYKGAEIWQDGQMVGQARVGEKGKGGELPAYTWKGSPLKLDNATTAEITRDTGIEYHGDLIADTISATNNTQAGLRVFDVLKNLKSSNLVARANEAPEGWKEIHLKNLEGYKAPKEVAAELNALHKKMMALKEDPSAYQKISNMMIATGFIFPDVHLPNVFDHGLTTMGASAWVKPSHYRNISKAFKAASLMSNGSMAKNAIAALDATVNSVASDTALKYLNAGGQVMNQNPERTAFMKKYFELMKEEFNKKPEASNAFLRKLGATLDGFNEAVNFVSDKVWMMDNAIRITATLDMAKKMGVDINNPQEFRKAVEEVDRSIPNYRVPASGPGSILFNHDNVIFGRYHYGMLKAVATKVKDGFNPKVFASGEGGKEARQRWIRNADKMAALAALNFALYPALDKIIQMVAGDDDMKYRRGGTSHLIGLASDAYKGKKTPGQVSMSVFTLNPVLKMAVEFMTNSNMYTGRDIYHPSDIQDGEFGNLAADAGKHIASGLGPVQRAQTAMRDQSDKKGGSRDAEDAVRHFFASMLAGKWENPEGEFLAEKRLQQDRIKKNKER